MAKVHVLIENPPPGGGNETNLNRARRFVRSGRAVFTAPLVIRFVSAIKQETLAERIAQLKEERMHALTAESCDRVRGDWRRHARHIPVIHPEKIK